MTLAKDGPQTGGQFVGRGTPQSGIPTQGASSWSGPPGSRPSGPFPMPPLPRPPGPPSGPIAPDAQTSLVDRPTAPPKGPRLGTRSSLRWALVGVLAALQVFVLFSAVMWWVGGAAGTNAVASMTPMSWTGVVYDVGNAGVNLRADSKVDPANSRDTAMRGSRLALSCGQTGDVVHKGDVSTATWLKTTDGLFVSMLYVHVPDRQSIPSCDGSKVDGPLLALADPANPQLPPPPGTQIGSAGGSASRGAATPAGGAVVAAPGAIAPAVVPPTANGTKTTAPQLSGQATAAAPTGVVGEGSGPSHDDHEVVRDSHNAQDDHSITTNPDTTPVG
ncbi:hypothetical protein [Actinomycetospora chiangmaiensis]|uniref:hypothetical protein n=1 Tax=Actinomycetospora chiangmaiensis TaxID=402650 RepID=UPI0003A63C2F|nr:hypothetical protein [Actinomycetospora chiangmaiensis]